MLSVRVLAQDSLSIGGLAWPTNGGSVASSPIQSPITQSLYMIEQENRAIGGVVSASDPNGLFLIYNIVQNWNNASSSSGPKPTASFSVTPNNNYVGTDSNVWYADNSFLKSTNTIFSTFYSTNLGDSICGVPFTGNHCSLTLPFVRGTNYFFSIYSQDPVTFSNLYYWCDSCLNWGQVPTANSYSNIVNFNGLGPQQGTIYFPKTITNMILCCSIFGSNSPCTMISPTNFNLIVVTNTSTTFSLQGNGPTYVISQIPTNGYLTNLNGTNGQVTYVQSNNLATVDSFTYCTSNSSACMSCAQVGINIEQNSLNCGECFNTANFNGGIVTGNIQVSTGVPFEQVCVSYTNALCLKATNCSVADANGVAKFFVHFCPGSSNVCIVQIGSCSGICFFTHVNVSGSGEAFPRGNGDYYFNTLIPEPPPPQTATYIYVVLTNTDTGIGGSEFVYQSSTNDSVNGNPLFDSCNINPSGPYYNPAYSFIVNYGNSIDYFSSAQVFNTDCTPFNPGNGGTTGAITGWQMGIGGGATCGFVPPPLVVIFDGLTSYNICTTNCP